MRTLIVYVSVHHGNTERVARAMAEALNAEIVTPDEINPGEVVRYDMVGFGSGIYFLKHHKKIIQFARKLPHGTHRAFIFSTRGSFPRWICHAALKKALVSRGWTIVDEFSCRGYDTYGPLKYIGGINRGKPNERDLENARAFAERLCHAEK